MKDILLPLIATREGWAFRQILKGITVACASMTTWLLAQGVDASTSAAIVAGISSALAWGAEFGLSKLASKIATPCLALACLLLTSCGSTPTGEKTFIGITSAGWLNVGKSAAVAAVPVALDERSKTSAKNPVKVQ
jgi:hypothetical protein